jgi:hypothetical protein
MLLHTGESETYELAPNPVQPLPVRACLSTLERPTLPVAQNKTGAYVCATSTSACKKSLPGTMLIATAQRKSSVFIGMLSAGNVCNGSKGVFMRVDAVHTWALSVMGPSEGVFQPKVDFNLMVTSVSAPGSWVVKVTPGSSDRGGSTSFQGNCGEEGSMVKDQGKGAFLVEFEAFGCMDAQCPPVEFQATWTAAGCAAKSHVQCIMNSRCMWMNDACQEKACSLALSWKDVFKMVKRGDAVTGRMGKRTVVNDYMEMAVWACVRDWDAAAQTNCGVGNGEFVCFGYEEKSKQFLPLGPNSARKILRDVQPQQDSIASLWAHLGVQ